MQVKLNLHIEELTQAKFDQVLIPLIMGFARRGHYNNTQIDWSLDINCSGIKLDEPLPQE